MTRAPLLLSLLAVLALGVVLIVTRERPAPESVDPVAAQARASSPAAEHGLRAPELVTAGSDGARVALDGSAPASGAPITAGAAAKPIVVSGTVTYRGDQAAKPPVHLFWTHASGATRSCWANGGTFSIDAMLAGRWSVHTTADGYRPREQSFVLDPSEAEARGELVLEPALRIPVRFVTPDGLSLARAREQDAELLPMRESVLLTKHRPPSQLPTETPETGFDAPEGRCEYLTSDRWAEDQDRAPLPDGVAGVLHVEGELPLYASAVFGRDVIQTVEIGAPVPEVVFTVDPLRLAALRSRLTARLVDGATAVALGEGFLSMNRGEDPAGTRLPEALRRASMRTIAADPDGVAHAEYLEPCRYEVRIHSPGYASAERRIKLEPGVTLDLGTIELERSVRFSGHVVGPDGEPRSARMRLVREPAPGQPGVWAQSESEPIVGEGGAFEIRLDPGSWLVEVGSGAGGGSKGDELGAVRPRLDTRNGPFENQRIELVATVPVTLLPDLARGQMMYAILPAGSSVALRRGYGIVQPETVRLVPGKYVLKLGTNGTFFDDRPLVVGDAPITIDSRDAK